MKLYRSFQKTTIVSLSAAIFQTRRKASVRSQLIHAQLMPRLKQPCLNVRASFRIYVRTACMRCGVTLRVSSNNFWWRFNQLFLETCKYHFVFFTKAASYLFLGDNWISEAFHWSLFFYHSV